MALYVIGDFHMSFSVNKPMEVFGKEWKNHVQKIEKYWNKKVTDEDTAVITGDHSWGGNLQESEADLDFIAALPDRKILLRESFEAARFAGYERFIMFLHYPPTSIGKWKARLSGWRRNMGQTKSFILIAAEKLVMTIVLRDMSMGLNTNWFWEII